MEADCQTQLCCKVYYGIVLLKNVSRKVYNRRGITCNRKVGLMILVRKTLLLHVKSIQNTQYIISDLPLSRNVYLRLLEIL